MTTYRGNKLRIIKFKSSGLFSFTYISNCGYGKLKEHGRLYPRSCIALFKALQEIDKINS